MYFKTCNDAKKMIDDINRDNIEATSEVKELSKAVSTAFVATRTPLSTLRDNLWSFLNMYFHSVEMFSYALKNTDYSTDEIKKIAISSVQATMSVHGQFWHIPVLEAALDIYNYALQKLASEKKICT